MDNSQPSFHSASTPRIERVRHDLKRRTLTVTDVERITPGMLRITLSGDDLADFVSLGADDHVKILVPSAEGTEERRDYTPRRYDAAARTLVLDFALHEAGPITEWAMNARPGDGLSVGGPRGSAVISNVERWLLIGDETALPAIGRRIEEATAGARITSIAAVADAAEQQAFETKADLTCHWVYRPLHQATDASALLAILSSVVIEPNTFVWVAAEASVTRAIRAHLTEERGYPLSWIKASGYWVKGKADSTEKFE
ncbi:MULTISPECIES: siderophore-interacting protein [Ensifer]|jgi:NADPH-dependent ferric siderophore reductase|uniref:SIP domain-containing protein n=1 Tax=Ensifer canadensis TaxID=555315 RepID=A0AAW4FM03_9HYPH|nr:MULTISPECIES: siderophore-interacting protein [Ensifer]MDP9634196.1 NADPH-dependent ferric siderophore reductase [Ensifer adhaerens]KQU93594.1 FAD-binding protein [Ensifer sp. Root31]KQW58585.1 FAD-binding protein [Ensifer sp. Root1252]KQW74288.1 FAD-binding protein [Ensifer sp. Root127]KQY78560.1 FAD-binding protein [Ensifer sp. Root142]